jgi:DNA-binding Xre family transcriptional regulator
MLFFNLPRILKQKGITHPFSHFMSLGYSRSTASKMAQNQIITFTVSKLEQYCIEFNCTPNELFEFRPSATNPLSNDHPLQSLKREDNTNEINALLHNLPIEKIRELTALIKNETLKE